MDEYDWGRFLLFCGAVLAVIAALLARKMGADFGPTFVSIICLVGWTVLLISLIKWQVTWYHISAGEYLGGWACIAWFCTWPVFKNLAEKNADIGWRLSLDIGALPWYGTKYFLGGVELALIALLAVLRYRRLNSY